MNNKLICGIISILSMILLFLSNTSAQEFQVGVSPLLLDLGEIQPGDSKFFTFSLITSSRDKFMVKLNAKKGDSSFFENRPGMLMYSSEEDPSSWVQFINNPLTIESEHSSPKIKRWEDVNLILNVPLDAEPGYHIFVIEPSPYVPGGTAPTGVSVVALTKITIIFKVAGDIIRSGNILDVTAEKVGSRTRINTFFQNNGTVSLSSRAHRIRIYYKNGTILKDLKSNIDHPKPGQVVNLVTFLNENEIKPGEYRVFVNVSYVTGYATKETTLFISAKEPSRVGGAVTAEEIGISVWIYLIPIIIVISYLVYASGRK